MAASNFFQPSRVRDSYPLAYIEYLDHNVVVQGLETGSFFKGKLRINSMYPNDGYITVDGLSVDVRVDGVIARNRALHGDVVAVCLLPGFYWKHSNDGNDITACSSVNIDENALLSLWRPNVQTDRCFFKGSRDQKEATNMLIFRDRDHVGLNELHFEHLVCGVVSPNLPHRNAPRAIKAVIEAGLGPLSCHTSTWLIRLIRQQLALDTLHMRLITNGPST